MDRIPIVVISDKKLVFAAASLFVNLLETKNENSFYELYLIASPDFEEEDKKNIMSIKDLYPKNCTINIVSMDNRFDNIKNETGYISNACAYKFCIAELFPQYSKMLYLDTDIIVFDDLTELYNINIDDNYIGGVFSVHHYLQRKNLAAQLGLDDILQYVNAGVLLFNLDKIREDNIIEKCLRYIGTFKDSVDQHIYNKICYPKIKLIPPKYNVTATSDIFYENMEATVNFSEKEILETRNPVIYHYTGRAKPWNTLNVKYGAIWLRYLKKTLYNNYIQKPEINKKERYIRFLGFGVKKSTIKKILLNLLNN